MTILHSSSPQATIQHSTFNIRPRPQGRPSFIPMFLRICCSMLYNVVFKKPSIIVFKRKQQSTTSNNFFGLRLCGRGTPRPYMRDGMTCCRGGSPCPPEKNIHGKILFMNHSCPFMPIRVASQTYPSAARPNIP